jgi:hypothetical protein
MINGRQQMANQMWADRQALYGHWVCHSSCICTAMYVTKPCIELCYICTLLL